MIRRFNADTQWQHLVDASPAMGALPRQTRYGDAPGLVPFGAAYPDKLVDEADYKEVITHCHEHKIFTLYHQYNSWAPEGFRWNQNGLGYCWAWGVTAAVMDCRAREGRETVLLAPVSLGWLVNWRNRGNYLESAIRGARERGIAPAEYVPDPHSLSHRSYRDGWEEAAMRYRLGETWDCDPSRMIQHAISVLATGTPLYIAYNWWGHALECCGIRWDERERYNVVWQIRNSHNEDDLIELTGTRGVPDEAYGVRATLTV